MQCWSNADKSKLRWSLQLDARELATMAMHDHETRISSDVLSLYARSEDEDGDASEGEITEQTASDNDFLSEISDNLFASDDYGPPIAEKLAKIANKNLETELDLEKLKAIIKSYKRPENCEQLYVPRINPEIWGNLTKTARKMV